MTRTLPIIAVLAVAGCTQLAAAASWALPPSSDVAAATAGDYGVEAAHTQVMFDVLHMGFTHYRGVFSGVTGAMHFTPNDPSQTHVVVSVPVASVLTTSAKLNGELVGADWLDAAKFPAMIFASDSVQATGAQTADITGTLTLHGVARPVVLHAKFVGGGRNVMSGHQAMGFEAQASIKRSDFGVKTYVPLVGDEVTITIAAAFEKM